MNRAATLLIGAAFLPATALAQPEPAAPPAADQPGAVDVGTPRPMLTTDAPTQISTSAESTAVETQLTSDRASHQQPAQISSGPPSAQAPEGLSRPAEGRSGAVEAVTGTDRCDPAAVKDKQSEICRRVIESRADEYARPAPTEPSPEQKLLLAQQWGVNAADALNAASRLAKSGSPDDSPESLGVASIVLQHSQPTPPDDKKDENPSVSPALDAIIQAITQAPPQN